MFRLQFSPRFAFQQRRFLSLERTPEIDLTGPIEQALQHLENASDLSSSETAKTSAELWRICFGSAQPLFWKATAFSCISSFCATGSALIAVNLLRPDQKFSGLLLCASGYFTFNTLSQIGNFLTNRMRTETALTTETTLVSLISRKILHLSTAGAMKQSSGNLKVLITSDVKNVSEFLNNFIRNLIPSLVSILIMAPALIHFSGKAGWIGLFTLGLIVPLALFLNRISTHFQDLTQNRMDELATLVGEWVKNIRLVRFLSWDASFEMRIESKLKQFMQVAVLQHLMACLIFGFSTTWWMITGASVLLFAKIFHYPLAVGGFFGSLWLLTFIAGYFTHMPNTIRLWGMALSSMKRISVLLREQEQADFFEPGPPPGSGLNPVKILFDGVGFHYPGADTAGALRIEDLNIEIDLRQKTAILGEIGSGKTTFLKLLCGEIPPTRGKIWIEFEDGSRRSLWETETHGRFRQNLAVVPQIAYVSSDLLSANISFSSDSDESALIHAIQKAEMEEDLLQFTDGMHQMIGESGVNLSGGQKQRLNLARAFHSGRPYLVLDDTLSAVDLRTEAALMERICTSVEGVLLVTHRLKEIKRMEQVLVFQEGHLIEAGKPLELMGRPGSAFLRALEAYSHA